MRKPTKAHLRLYLPLLVLGFLAIFLLRGLWLDPKKLPSVFIDKPLPGFTLPMLSDVGKEQMFAEDQLVALEDLAGKPWVLNVFASWCQACVVEHPHLIDLAKRGEIILVGLAYKDDPVATRSWLNKYGNPYNLILQDSDGRAGIDFGVYGVPETFVMNSQGVVKYKHVGPIDPTFFSQNVQPVLDQEGSPS